MILSVLFNKDQTKFFIRGTLKYTQTHAKTDTKTKSQYSFQSGIDSGSHRSRRAHEEENENVDSLCFK